MDVILASFMHICEIIFTISMQIDYFQNYVFLEDCT